VQPKSPSYAAVVAHRLTTVMLVFAVVVGAYQIGDALTGAPREVSFHAEAPLDFDQLPKGTSPTGDSRIGVEIEQPTAREQRLALAADIAPLLLLVAVLWVLRGVARSVRDGDPFGRENVRRLRAIGVLLIIGVLAVQAADSVFQNALADPYVSIPTSSTDSLDGLRPAGNDFPAIPLLCGLGAFVLAQVFAHGAALREDVEATI